MSRLDEIEALLAETTGWLEWISPKATTEIAVVYSDGDVYLPTGGTPEEFAFANAQGKVRRLVRAEDVAPLAAFARRVEAVLDDHVSTNEQVFDELGRAMKQLKDGAS